MKWIGASGAPNSYAAARSAEKCSNASTNGRTPSTPKSATDARNAKPRPAATNTTAISATHGTMSKRYIKMTPEDREIAIQFSKVDKQMRDAMKVVTVAMLILLMVMTYFFWFITR